MCLYVLFDQSREILMDLGGVILHIDLVSWSGFFVDMTSVAFVMVT